MFRILVNKINSYWNQTNFWFHDMAVKINIGWLVSLSVWFYDRMHWTLSNKWQLIGDKPYDKYMLEYELYIAQHQVRYYANLAYEYQWALIEAMSDDEESQLVYDEQTKTEKQPKGSNEG